MTQIKRYSVDKATAKVGFYLILELFVRGEGRQLQALVVVAAGDGDNACEEGQKNETNYG